MIDIEGFLDSRSVEKVLHHGNEKGCTEHVVKDFYVVKAWSNSYTLEVCKGFQQEK